MTSYFDDPDFRYFYRAMYRLACAEAIAERRDANRARINASHRAWCARNRERIASYRAAEDSREKRRDWYARNRGVVSAQRRAARRQDRARVLQREREYAEANRERIRQSNAAAFQRRWACDPAFREASRKRVANWYAANPDRAKDRQAVDIFLRGTDLTRADLPPELVAVIKTRARVRRAIKQEINT